MQKFKYYGREKYISIPYVRPKCEDAWTQDERLNYEIDTLQTITTK